MLSRCALIVGLSGALLILTVPAAGLAQNSPITFLDAVPAKDGGGVYSVTPGSDLALPFTVNKGGKLELYLSPLRGEYGDTEAIEFSIDGLAAAKDQRVQLTAAEGSIFRLRLKVPALNNPGKYSGTLGVLLDGKLQQVDRLVLTRTSAQRQAKLTVDWKSLTAYQPTLSVLNALGLIQSANFSLQVRNPGADWPAEGIFLRVLDVTAPPGNNFDPEKNLQITWNGLSVNDLWRSRPADGSRRSIAPNQQVAIGVQPRDLSPGEYIVKIGMGASNATIDNENPIILKLFVKDGVLLPLAILLLAISISWIATKGLEGQRKRASQLAKVNEIKKGSWRQERDSMPTVAARAFLKQAEDRNQRWFDALFGPDTTAAHITKAELLAKILERVAYLGRRIGHSGWTPLNVHQANKCLTDIVASINPGTIDASSAAKAEEQLAGLEKWFDPREHERLYMEVWKKDLEDLVEQANPDAFESPYNAPPYDKLIGTLRGHIDKGRAPGAQRGDVEKMERAYGILKVLWERRKAHDTEALRELFGLLEQKQQIDMDDFFHAADSNAWSALEQAHFKFIEPGEKELEPRRAYELIEFEIEPDDPKLGENFLFKHKATYVWTLKVQEGVERKTVTEQRTNEPRVVQYAPKPGKYYMAVALEYEGKSAQKPPCFGPFTVIKSSEYGVLSIFRFTEMAALGIATLFAVITGFGIYYFGKAAFGSITDYLSLFIWGAGVDQTKNFLQQLAKTSGTG